MKSQASYWRIQKLQQDKEQAERVYLQRFGWTETCKTPGAYWLWQKELDDGRVVLVGREQAVNMTLRAFDEDPDGP